MSSCGETNGGDEHDAWSAFRYVAGEMSVDEEWAFEERLANEQPLRERVAEAATLSAAVCEIESHRACRPRPATVPARSRRSSGLAVVTGAVAAAVLLVAVALQFTQPAGEAVPVAGGDDEPADVASRGASAEELLAERGWIAPVSDESTLMEGADADADSDSDEFVVPDWMLAAVKIDVERERTGIDDDMSSPVMEN